MLIFVAISYGCLLSVIHSQGVSQTVHKVVQVMMLISLRVFQAEKTWRVIGFMSCVVGFLCFELSPSFYRLIGNWTPFKLFMSVGLRLAILTTILFAKPS
jgi:hypothetical protein